MENCRFETQDQIVLSFCIPELCWCDSVLSANCRLYLVLKNMVGLRNRSTWEPLLLKASCIKSCANGCSIGITAHLTYANADTESVDGEFLLKPKLVLQ